MRRMAFLFAGLGLFAGDQGARGQSPGEPAASYVSYLGESGTDICWAIALDPRGGVLVAGASASPAGDDDALVVKLSKEGRILWSRRIGGAGDDAATGLAAREDGSVVVAGSTASADFPVRNAFQSQKRGDPRGVDAFLLELSPDGAELRYSTFLGGSADEGGFVKVVLDGAGQAYVAGTTASSDFPVTRGALQVARAGGRDAFVTIFAPDGWRIRGTYLGGSGEDLALDTALLADAEGNPTPCVVGHTASTNFRTTPDAFQKNCQTTLIDRHIACGSTQAFIAQLSGDCSELIYSTLLGGSGLDAATAVATDAEGNLWVGGETSSDDFPATEGAFMARRPGTGSAPDAFVARLVPGPKPRLSATLLGGAGVDAVWAIATAGPCGGVFACGGTTSRDFPIAGSEGHAVSVPVADEASAFVVHLSGDLSQLLYSSFVGGSGEDFATALGVEPDGAVVLTGKTSSVDLPTTVQAASGTLNGEGDSFLARLPIAPLADLAIRVEDSSRGGGKVYRELEYSFTITNRGGEDASAVAVEVELPAGFNVTASEPPGLEKLVKDGSLRLAVGDLPSGGVVKYRLAGVPTVGGKLALSARVFSSGCDRQPHDNQEVELTRVKGAKAHCDDGSVGSTGGRKCFDELVIPGSEAGGCVTGKATSWDGPLLLVLLAGAGALRRVVGRRFQDRAMARGGPGHPPA